MQRNETVHARHSIAPWAVVAIVVFVIVDAGLVWWALASLRSDAGTPQGEVLPTLPPSTTVPASTSPTSTGEPAAPVAVARPTVVLAALDANLAYRGVVGRCPDAAATLEVTTDGGATWTPAYTAGLSDLQSIEPADVDIVTMVARDPAACGVGRYRSFVQGADWEPTSELEPTWYLDGGQVAAPTGSSDPCGGAAVQVEATSAESAAVLCGSGAVATTVDSGVSWADAGAPPTTIALASTSGGYLVAVTDDGCRGIRIQALAPDAAPGACLEADITTGTTAIDAASDGTLWAWTGGVLARSANGGATW
ncbi:hypothetical protein [Agromyces sp. PvR057]|uniref:hypothetical protein n=1 Tax=Agromyces sp. PvR057 TaxID=3156403 RepID=UPI00339A7B10